MILLIVFAFLAGVVTILSPCILPVLPIILSSSVDTTGKRRPIGVVVGFVLSFTFFTLFLSTIVRLSGIPAESLRFVSIIILIFFGLSLLIPKVQLLIELLFSRIANIAPNGQDKHGFFGGLVIGFSLGLLWTPCVGPILASVISLAITGSVNAQAFIITLAYSLGTAIPMFIIMQAGSTALQKVPWLTANTAKIQKAFGVLMVLTAIGIYFNVDRKFQTLVLDAFPNYGIGLTKVEDNESVKKELKNIDSGPINEKDMGRPSSDLIPKGSFAPSLIPGGEWFNSKPLTLNELKGKVVIIDFWTYSCINCQRTFPYLKTWWNKYKDKGLVIIGVHSPEFEFEKDANNVRKAISDFGLEYPIVQDNNFSTWRAYNNRYWPAKYFIDKDGYIRYSHFGEGDYDQSEKVIQELLKEAGASDITDDTSNPEYQVYARTPETYLGSARTNYSTRLIGDWSVTSEYASPKKGASLELDFDAKEVYLVMRSMGGNGKVKVYVDNAMQYFGEDNKNGTVIVSEDRLYKIIKLPTPGKHLLRLEFDDDFTSLYAFTFG